MGASSISRVESAESATKKSPSANLRIFSHCYHLQVLYTSPFFLGHSFDASRPIADTFPIFPSPISLRLYKLSSFVDVSEIKPRSFPSPERTFQPPDARLPAFRSFPPKNTLGVPFSSSRSDGDDLYGCRPETVGEIKMS